MAVVIETTVGDLTVDLLLDERPRACQNFLKLCALKYYNYNLFHTIQQGFIAQTGDPTGAGLGGSSVWGVLDATGDAKRYFKAEQQPRIRHSEPGLLSMVSLGDGLIGSQFFLTLGADLTSLDNGTGHCVIGRVTEGSDVLRRLNETICDATHRPYQDVRITHTVVLDDPFENPRGFRAPSRSPSPSAERLQNGRIGADEDVDDRRGKTEQEIAEMLQEREARAQATILEIVGDLPDADMAPPENVLFVCKLNPVTSDDDMEIIFSRFGKVVACEVIRDRTTGDSLQYAFVEFEDAKTCESAYFKMDNVLIDDRRIHVDFSQSVAKVQWRGKGRGLIYKDGQKGDRLNFGDLKESGDGTKAERAFAGPRNGNRNDRQNQRPQNGDARDRRDPDHRQQRSSNGQRVQRSPSRERRRGGDRQRSRDRGDNRGANRADNRLEQRREYDGRQRHRSRSPSERQRPVDQRSRSDRDTRIDRSANDRPETRDRYHRQRSRSPRRQRSRSPARNSERRPSNVPAQRRLSPARSVQREPRSSTDTESDSSDDKDHRQKRSSKKTKSKKAKKSKKSKKKSAKRSRKHSSSSSSEDSDSDSTDDSSESDDGESKRRKDRKHRK